jgi:hypothetical protein
MIEVTLKCSASLMLLFPWMIVGSVLAADHDPFETIEAAMLDRSTFAQSLAGKESPLSDADAKGGPDAAVWTKSTRPEWNGVRFGTGTATGVRHLRIGFVKDIAVGSVLVRAGGRLSVLKPTAKYPGELDDESNWLSAERLSGGQISQHEVGEDEYALWSPPTGTMTRALRFTHTPQAGDREAHGYLGDVWILSGRYGNVAPPESGPVD